MNKQEFQQAVIAIVASKVSKEKQYLSSSDIVSEAIELAEEIDIQITQHNRAHYRDEMTKAEYLQEAQEGVRSKVSKIADQIMPQFYRKEASFLERCDWCGQYKDMCTELCPRCLRKPSQ